ncbi:cysteine protease, putative [Entamoeba histolytica HM-1:IMSS-B]|uniref:Cysteine protease, putative n=1 Tax=Entamoeba histolytica HM-1:IMSS-B TaxID=885319 RepID=M3UR71_ENTH1|nr:cysteine protease, putative [Entamoeba histolytica HM-1:IMSS-B]
MNLILLIIIYKSFSQKPSTFYGLLPKKSIQPLLSSEIPLRLHKNNTFYPFRLNEIPSSLSYCGIYRKRNPHKTEDYCIKQTMNQGECGGCYAMALAQVLQAHYTHLTLKHQAFSTQQIIDCSNNNGCSGGWPTSVLESLQYFVSEIEYPYRLITINGNSTNNYKKECIRGRRTKIHVSDYKEVIGPITFEQIKVLLIEHGPFIGMIYSNDQLRKYSGGILHLDCPVVPTLNHAIIVVGYGQENQEKYIIIRNSWGNSWGEMGYARISMNDLCGLDGIKYSDYPTILYLKTQCLFLFFFFKYHN